MSQKELDDLDIARTARMSALYDCLTSTRRCYVITLLEESDDEVVSVRALAQQIAAIEQNVQPDHATGKPYRSVYNSLVQTHLHVLEDLSIIEYQPDRKIVSVGDDLDDALLLLRVLR